MRLKLGQRAFSYAAPAAWDSLPPSLQQMTNTDSFKRHLKTDLFFITRFNLVLVNFIRFYPAMHFSAKRGIVIACRLSVCLSVCLSIYLSVRLSVRL